MISTAVTIHNGSALTLTADQDFWNEKQLAGLRQLGIDGASNGDLAVFMHVAQRTGLDPFARQIHFIQRQGKWTIQTAIDGYRLIARRSADHAHETLSIGESQWCSQDGQWADVWLSDSPPAAARVTVLRDGQPFPAIALWREYVQTKSNGEVTAMWRQRPAGQLAKCAEALALRKAFPQDLSGIYTDDEMASAHRDAPATNQPVRSAAERVRAIVTPQTGEAGEASDMGAPSVDDPASPDFDEPPMSDQQRRRIFAQFGDMGVTDEQLQRDYMTNVLGRTVTSRGGLTLVEADQVAEAQQMDLLPKEN